MASLLGRGKKLRCFISQRATKSAERFYRPLRAKALLDGASWVRAYITPDLSAPHSQAWF